LVFGMFSAAILSAQDIHFTQFYMVPQGLNPALAGKFEGSVRFGGIYRSQWRSVLGSGNGYSTPSIFVDAPIIKGFRKKDWVGVGLSVFQDEVGTMSLKHNGSRLGASYHLALDSRRQNVLSVGYGFGGESRRIDGSNASFYDALQSGMATTDLIKANQDYNLKYKEHMAGVVLSSKLNKQMDMNIGFSMFHINKPKATLIQNTFAKVPRRAVAHGQFNIQTSKTLTISPSFIIMRQAGIRDIAVQMMTGYLFNPKKAIYLDAGLGYRLSDAAELLGGIRYKDLKVGFAYDVNTSSLRTETGRRGAFEIGVNYMVRIYKPPVRKQLILCPRF
jgi:type IX secretion system PorP/SprF family membrane protein